MNVKEALNARFACRAFRPDPISKETIQEILMAATRAPSWANTQPWEIFVAGGEILNRIRRAFLANFQEKVPGNPDFAAPQNWPQALRKRTEELMKERLDEIEIERNDTAARNALLEANYRFFGAPIIIYLCMDRTLTPWSIFDLGSLAQSIMLEALEYGLNSAPAFMLVSHPEIIRAELDIPKELSIIIGIAIGHSDMLSPQNKFQSHRRPIQESVRFKGL